MCVCSGSSAEVETMIFHGLYYGVWVSVILLDTKLECTLTDMNDYNCFRVCVCASETTPFLPMVERMYRREVISKRTSPQL